MRIATRALCAAVVMTCVMLLLPGVALAYSTIDRHDGAYCTSQYDVSGISAASEADYHTTFNWSSARSLRTNAGGSDSDAGFTGQRCTQQGGGSSAYQIRIKSYFHLRAIGDVDCGAGTYGFSYPASMKVGNGSSCGNATVFLSKTCTATRSANVTKCRLQIGEQSFTTLGGADLKFGRYMEVSLWRSRSANEFTWTTDDCSMVYGGGLSCSNTPP